MSIEDIDILSLIPQRPPFIMIDHLIHYDEVVTKTVFRVTDDCLFCHNGELVPAGIIENIAQTCAARIGYINRLSNEEVKIGVIGSVQNLTVNSQPHTGDLLETEIIVSNVVFAVTIVDAYVKCKGNIVAQCSMKIAIIEDSNEKN
jgi:3-hydroxymyristoyl/3-hydroxydecanoyl-(acyl carrier protein) dehydratase